MWTVSEGRSPGRILCRCVYCDVLLKKSSTFLAKDKDDSDSTRLDRRAIH